ncbi:MAG TPA: effector binding domain-containing protein [Mucilaginibacter sp.]|jgi:predicted transcriptional regulator YdeE|nr:effector binding domain-containing protein [Mucilaginibacter sp.]
MRNNAVFKFAEEKKFFVSGIRVCTTNEKGQARKDIGDLWTKFMSEELQHKIPGKLSEDVYCVYTDYESDHTGWYTAVIGCRVSEPEIDTAWFTALVPAGTFRVYQPQGKFPDCVANTWMQIWQDGVTRNYLADYDLYKAGAKSFEETETEIHLGVV